MALLTILPRFQSLHCFLFLFLFSFLELLLDIFNIVYWAQVPLLKSLSVSCPSSVWKKRIDLYSPAMMPERRFSAHYSFLVSQTQGPGGLRLSSHFPLWALKDQEIHVELTQASGEAATQGSLLGSLVTCGLINYLNQEWHREKRSGEKDSHIYFQLFIPNFRKLFIKLV